MSSCVSKALEGIALYYYSVQLLEIGATGWIRELSVLLHFVGLEIF